jgi:RHS repeat-associated protein
VAKKSGGAASDCTGGTFQKLYWRALSGNALTETDGSGSVTANYTEYVFFADRRIASRVTGSNSANTALFYYFADQLGSTRTVTTGSGKNNDSSNQTPGQLCYDADFTPYGQEISYSARLQTTACPPSYKFTGYERDPETGLDYAFARYYSSRLGRFLSTDPLAGSVGDLQSHNAYAYVVNNPMNLTDPAGLCPHGRPGQCDGYISPPCHYFCVEDGGGYGLDGNCYLNGAPASCSMVNGLLSSPSDSPSGATVRCQSSACMPGVIGVQVIDGPGGTSILQRWIPSITYDGVITMDSEGVNVPYIVPAHWDTVEIINSDSSDFYTASATNGIERLEPLMEVQERAELFVTKRIFLPGMMIAGGITVAVSGLIATGAVCATGVGCLASPITLTAFIGGLVLIDEGIYYAIKGEFYAPPGI